MDTLTAHQRGALRQLIDPSRVPDSAYATISVAELRAALGTIDALEVALREAGARLTRAEMDRAALAPLIASAEALALADAAALRHLDQPPTTPPVGGVWLLNEASVIVEYEHGLDTDSDGGEMRRLDLVEAGRVLIIGLTDPDPALPAGLTTLVPVAGCCRVCGCSQFNACETEAGPCGWVEPDLCSACAGKVAA